MLVFGVIGGNSDPPRQKKSLRIVALVRDTTYWLITVNENKTIVAKMNPEAN